jgi:hypothetical protein
MRLAATVGAPLFTSFLVKFAGQQAASRFLVTWVGDADSSASDFLAVLDVLPGSSTLRQVIQTLPVGERGTGPHHTEHFFTPPHPLFANGWPGNRRFRFDLSNPARPKLLGSLDTVPGLAFPHSFSRLPRSTSPGSDAQACVRLPARHARVEFVEPVQDHANRHLGARTGNGRARIVHDRDDAFVSRAVVLPGVDWTAFRKRRCSSRQRHRLAERDARTGVDRHDCQLSRSGNVVELLAVARPEGMMGTCLGLLRDLVRRPRRRKHLHVDFATGLVLEGSRCTPPSARPVKTSR